MVAGGLVGSDSNVISFPIAGLGNVTFLACCGTSHVTFVFVLFVQVTWYSFVVRKSFKMCTDLGRRLIVLR